jgi:hypothetical protein
VWGFGRHSRRSFFGLPGRSAGPSVFENFNFRLNRTREKLIETAYFFAISCENRSKHDRFSSRNLVVATAAKWGRNPAPSMKNVVLQELAPAMFHVEHKENRIIRLSSPADWFSLFTIFAVLGLPQAGFRRRLLKKPSTALFIGVGNQPHGAIAGSNVGGAQTPGSAGASARPMRAATSLRR